MITSRRILPKIRDVPNESYSENQVTHFIFRNFFPIIAPFIEQCGKI
jgi:hypothetical protein